MNFDANAWLNQLYSTPEGTPGGVAAVDAYGKNMAAGLAQGAQFAGNSGAEMTRSYLQDYQPYDKKFMGYVDNLGTEGYRAQQRGQAMTGVQQQADMQGRAMDRQMAAMGINPNSARFQAVHAAAAQQTALNKVQAAMGADRSSRDEWAKGLGAINAMGLKTGELGVKNMAVAGDLSKTGLAAADLGSAATDRQTNAGAAATGAGAAAMNAGTNATNSSNNYDLGRGRLALDRYQIDTTADYNNRALGLKADQGSVASTIGTGLATAGTKWLANGGIDTIGSAIKNVFGGGNVAPSGDSSAGWDEFYV